MGFALTEEQAAVVKNRGGALLVSAAAGSGKTRVLVERLLDRVVNEGRNIDEFLVITFTRAAAAELRARIGEELHARLAKAPEDSHLRRQTMLIYKTQISTIHAFCTTLLREFAQLLELAPDFRLCEDTEAATLRLAAIDTVMERRYEIMETEENRDWTALVDMLAAGRDDGRLMQIALDVYDKVQSHPDPNKWLAEQEEIYALEHVTDVGQTVWGALLLESARRQAAYWQARMEKTSQLCEADEALMQNYGGSIAVTAESLRDFCAAAEQGWDAAAERLPIPFPTAGRKKQNGGQDEAETVKAVRKACKDRMEKVAALFTDKSDALLEDMRLTFPAVRGLFALVRDFGAEYGKEKKRREVLDFSDLEHLTVRLLYDGDGQLTETARHLQGRYAEIMVDEYQDTNEVQNAIFSALALAGKNLFMVGDVKQSIYRFRLADPTIFLGKYHSFQPASQAEAGEDRKILLSCNFRSRDTVLEGTNYIFSNIMSTELGEMEYTEDERLRPGADFPADGDYRVELDVIQRAGNDGEERDDGEGEKTAKDLVEARFTARRIAEVLSSGLQVEQGEQRRPVRATDIVILLRAPGSVLHHYARALGEVGIPWQADGGEDFFAATEVSVALSLLRVVDNPRQDVALLAVLRSPLYNFSADRLAELRALCEGEFYEVLEWGAKAGEQDCGEFLAALEALRFGAGDKSACQLIWEIYEKTGLLGIFGAMTDGGGRQNRLLSLYELAKDCESTGHVSLFQFLTYLDHLREGGVKPPVAAAGRESAGVRILSIHRSKGLEFPVVFLCGLSRQINMEDMKKPVLFHSRLGVGPKGLDTERMVEFPTLSRMAIAYQLGREAMAEEMRLLYVAMTRAKEKLILVHMLPGSVEKLASLRAELASPVDPQTLAACRTVGDWILLAALARPEAMTLRGPAGLITETPATEFGPEWDIRLVDGSGLEASPPPCGRVAALPEATDTAAQLEAVLAWRYPHSAMADIPSKLTATQLKGRFLDEESADEAPKQPRNQPLQRPVFAQEKLGLTPAQRGTALHLAMQYIDFERTENIEEIRAEIARITDMALITELQAAAAEPARIKAFFEHALGRELRGAKELHREFKFSILVPAQDYYAQAEPSEQVLLQGVVDCWFETAQGVTVVDFKSDRVTEKTLAARAEEYRPQLAAYSRALEEITGKTVARRMLWFFACDSAVQV